MEVEPPLEVELPFEVEAGGGLGQAKRGHGGVKMRPGPGLGDTGSWMGSIWRRDNGYWIWPRAVRGGRNQKHLLWRTSES